MVATNSGLWYAGDKPVVAAYNKGEQVYPLGGGTDPVVNESYFSTFINNQFLQALDQQIHYKHDNGITFFTRITPSAAIAPTNAAAWTSNAPAGAYEFDFDWSHDASWSGLPFKRINPENIPDYIFDCMNYPTEWTQNDSEGGKARYPYYGYHTLYIPKPGRRSTVADVRNVFYTTKDLMWQAPNPPADLPDQIYFVEIDNQDAYDFTAWDGSTLTKPDTVTLLVGVTGNNLVEPDEYSEPPMQIWIDSSRNSYSSATTFHQHKITGHLYIQTVGLADYNSVEVAYRVEEDGSVVDQTGIFGSDPNLETLFGISSVKDYAPADYDLADQINAGTLRPTTKGPLLDKQQAEWVEAQMSIGPNKGLYDKPIRFTGFPMTNKTLVQYYVRGGYPGISRVRDLRIVKNWDCSRVWKWE